jgi:hypothetical protein
MVVGGISDRALRLEPQILERGARCSQASRLAITTCAASRTLR